MNDTDTDFDNIIDLVTARKIRRNDRWVYVNTTNGRVMDDAVYTAADEEHGYLLLRPDGAVKVTPAGRLWRRRGTAPTEAPVFQAPAGVA